jgi:hypothetical protein
MAFFASESKAAIANVSKKTAVTVAVVDTGIDFNHLAFKGMIVKGVNLLDYGEKPQDDHGHGTMVAGVVVNTYESYKQLIANPLPLKIMPVKALTAEGDGTETKLAEGIRYAVEQKADIIVLSLGLYENEPELEKAVLDAEKKGITVFAATGNDGESVKYPAAYPSVFAVGGMDADEQVVELSNVGEEVDVVASWRVYTTALGGTYTFNEGTSMAAPQAAAAAALYINVRDNLTPLQIRQQIRQTAKDIELPGWDMLAGYGVLRIERVLSQAAKADMFESNNRREEAKTLPLNSMNLAQMNTGNDRDWFVINPQYKGTIRFELVGKTAFAETIQINLYPNNNGKSKSYTMTSNKPAIVPVSAGQQYIELMLPGKDIKTYAYAFVNRFTIYRDEFEDNDRQYKAFALPLRSQTIVGTLDRDFDEDWYVFQTTKSGKLTVNAEPNHPRFDLVLKMQKHASKLQTIDRNHYNESEILTAYDIDGGKYYLSVSNADGSPVNSEYKLQFEFTAKQSNSNEPNDFPSQATKLKLSTPYFGQLSDANDTDYYQFTVNNESLFRLTLNNMVLDPRLKVTLFDSRANAMKWSIAGRSGNNYVFMRNLAKGNYFVNVALNDTDGKFKYNFSAEMKPLIAGYEDLNAHWAQDAIVALTKRNIIQGNSNFKFEPDRSISRAEAASLIVRAFKANQIGKVSFKDVKNTHWAYDEIAKAVNENIINGYPDDTFRPNRSITRAETSVMLVNALKLNRSFVSARPFRDVPVHHFAAMSISQLKALKIMNGVSDNLFDPEAAASRAQFAVALQAALANQ